MWLWTEETHKLYFESKVLNVTENKLKNSLIYPNPTNSIINIVLQDSIEEQKINRIIIYNLLGIEILNLTKNLTKIDVSKLNSGFYILKIVSSNNK